MIPTVYFGKLYRYKRIYSNIYIVCLNNRQIICIRDICFHKEDPPVGKIDEEALPEVVFNEEAEGFVLGEVMFGSGDRLLSSQAPGTSRL